MSHLENGHQMHEAAIGARSDDCSSLKHDALHNYVPSEPSDPSCALTPPIPKQKLKDDRGFNHPMLAALLCPHSQLNLFEVDSEYVVPHANNIYDILLNLICSFIHQLRDSTFPVYTDQWPSFLYDSADDFKYDPNNLDHGLLWGYFLERVPHFLSVISFT